MIVAAILVAAGSGDRLGADVPKAFVLVAGQSLLEHAAARFTDHPRIRDVVVAAPAALTQSAAELVPGARVVPGGQTRQESVARALAVLAADVDTVLVHDVARAFVPAAVIDRVLDALAAGAEAVVPTVAVTDTIRSVDGSDTNGSDTNGSDINGVGALGSTLDRSRLRAVQTPQGFARRALVAAHASGTRSATDDASLVEAAGGVVVAVSGAEEAFKVTVPLDLARAEAVLARG